MSWVPTLALWLMRQSNDTVAPSSSGEPVTPVLHCAAAKRSAMGVLPPNRLDRSRCAPARVFTQSCPLTVTMGCADALRFRHTSSVGGSSVTLHTAVAVKPARPLGPSVVMMLTAAARRAMASR